VIELDRRLRAVAVVLAVLGIGVAGYLVYVHYSGAAPICNIAHGCEKVQTSKYAKLAGVPVAVIGLAGYLAILTAVLVRTELARLAAAGFALVGLGFSGWLTYLEGARIHAWCQWCLSSAGLMTLLAIVCVWRATIVAAPSRTA
jgi:uncharacterized membrane protein